MGLRAFFIFYYFLPCWVFPHEILRVKGRIYKKVLNKALIIRFCFQKIFFDLKGDLIISKYFLGGDFVNTIFYKDL